MSVLTAHVCRLTGVPFTVSVDPLNGTLDDTVDYLRVYVHPPVEDDSDTYHVSPESDEVTGFERNVTVAEDQVSITTSKI